MADNKEQLVHKVWESIRMKHENDALGMAKAITYAAESSVIDSIKDREETRDYMKFMQATLTGNGNVETGLLSRLSKLERQMTSNCEQMKSLTTAIVGSVEKRGALVDLQLRTEKLEKSIDNLNKITWMVVATVVGQIILRLLDLF